MEIRAAEISAILKEQIAGFDKEADVAEVGVVVHREQIAELIEGQFLRVAQALVVDLHVAAVRVL